MQSQPLAATTRAMVQSQPLAATTRALVQSQPSAAHTRALGAIAAFGSDYKSIGAIAYKSFGCNRSLWQRLQEFWVQSQPLAATTRASGAIAAFGSDYKCAVCSRCRRLRSVATQSTVQHVLPAEPHRVCFALGIDDAGVQRQARPAVACVHGQELVPRSL